MTSIAVPSVSPPGDRPSTTPTTPRAIPTDVRPHPTDPLLWQVLSRSRGHEGLWRTVDAFAVTCDCEDYQHRRRHTPSGTLIQPNEGHWCYHLRCVLTMPVAALLSTLTAADAPTSTPVVAVCPGCGAPALPGEVYCAKTPYGRPWCARRALGALPTGPSSSTTAPDAPLQAAEPVPARSSRSGGLRALQDAYPITNGREAVTHE